jgi:MFS family permease
LRTDSTSPPPDRGFGPVLANPHFRALWVAQLLAQTSQHAIHFIQMVLIEQLTGSAIQIGLVILAFTLPGVIFSPVAGVVVDRFPKKVVLVASNLTRVVLASSYVVVLAILHGAWELIAIYIITFVTASLAQFFSPAEAATIPLLVGEARLLPANSLFNLTMAVSQVLGLLILGPLAVSLVGAEGGFVVIAAMYLAAALLVSIIPRDRQLVCPVVGVSGWRRMWLEAKEGWQFVSAHRLLQVAMAHLVTITTLIMVMAMLAPGYAARVLGIGPQSAVIVFAPAGVGMFLATGLVGRWGYWLRKVGFGQIGLALVGLIFGALGLLSLDYQRLLQPILHVYPQATFSLTSATMALAFLLGLCMSGVNILAQTTVQQESPAHIRGRVFSVQFMLNNLVGIPPMLALGGVADAIGIPRVLEIVGVAALVIAAASIVVGRSGATR